MRDDKYKMNSANVRLTTLMLKSYDNIQSMSGADWEKASPLF